MLGRFIFNKHCLIIQYEYEITIKTGQDIVPIEDSYNYL